MSYVCLYVTVLCFETVTLAYLASVKSISSLTIGIIVSGASISGVITTYFLPSFIKANGIMQAAAIGSYFQVSCVFVAVFILSLGVFGKSYIPELELPLIIIFCVMIIVSRLGLWASDLCVTQIMQMGVIPVEKTGTVNSLEMSLTKFATLLILVVSTVFGDPNYYVYLCYFSLFWVTISSVLFSFWYLRHGLAFQKFLRKSEAKI